MRSPRRWGLVYLALGLSLTPVQARADSAPASLPIRGASVVVEEGIVRASLAYRDVIDGGIAKQLESGLPTVIVYRGVLLPEKGGAPVALVVRSCRVAYDLWDEVFRVQMLQTGVGATQTVAVNLEGVLRQCGELRRAALLDVAQLRAGSRYFLTSLVEVNPLSTELLDRIHHWVARPGGEARISSADSLLASFVGLFVPRVGDADRKLAFRSAPFTRENPEFAAISR